MVVRVVATSALLAAAVHTQAPGTPRRATAAPASTVVDRIAAFAFDSRPGIGFGGAVTVRVVPLVLFTDGSVLLDIRGLADPAGLEAHRAARPAQWGRWRRNGGVLQVERNGRWARAGFQTTYATLPAGFRLDGEFRALSGVGTIATGGSAAVTAVTEYRFTSDGRVVRGRAVGATGTAGDVGAVTSTVPPTARGRYRIDGIVLHVTWDDGSTESRILVTDPRSPSSLWLDGVGYARRRR